MSRPRLALLRWASLIVRAGVRLTLDRPDKLDTMSAGLIETQWP